MVGSMSTAVKHQENQTLNFKPKNHDVQFTGTGLGFIGTGILSFLVTFLSLGICTPWGVAMYFKWEMDNTVVDGKRLQFKGSAWGLFATWIKWWLLTVVTFGIYGFWVYTDLRKWIAKNTVIVR